MSGRRVASLDELLPLLQLRNVRTNEMSGRRRDSFDTEGVPVAEGAAELRVRQEIQGNALIFRCRMDLATERALLCADVSGLFELGEPIEKPSDDVLEAFAAREGLPILYPYLRVIIQQVARQIGVPAPLLKPYWSRDFPGFLSEATAVRHAPGSYET